MTARNFPLMSLELYAIGNALVDSEYLVSDDFLTRHRIEKGCMTLIDEAQRHQLLDALDREHTCAKRASGGSAANSVIAFSAFGGSAFYACKVSDDDNGAFYLHDLRQAGVEAPAHAQASGGVTGTCVVMVTPDAERTMNTHLGITADMSAAELDLERLQQARFLYIEGYLATSDSARHAVATARRQTAGKNIRTALTFSDPAMVQYARHGLREMIADGVDILFCNEHEARLWAESDDLAQAVSALHAVSPLVVVTRGSEGALISDQGRAIHVEAFPVRAVDSNGAGDAFAGAFLFGLSRDWALADCGRLAARTAAQVVSRFGPRLPQEDYRAILASGH